MMHKGYALALVLMMGTSLVEAEESCCGKRKKNGNQRAEKKARVSTSNIIEFTSDMDFDALISNGNVVIDFGAPWCGGCRALADALPRIARDYSHVTFIKVDIDQNPAIAKRYNIKSIPVVIYFKDGEKLEQELGFSEKPLRGKLTKHYGK